MLCQQDKYPELALLLTYLILTQIGIAKCLNVCPELVDVAEFNFIIAADDVR